MRRSLYLSLFLLASCMSHKDYTSNITPMQSVSIDTEKIPDYSCFFDEGNWPSAKWWETFQDTDLSQLIELALSNNPSLKSAEEKAKSAYQQALTYRAKLFPHLFFHAQDRWEHFSKDSFNLLFPGSIGMTDNFINLSLDFKYELDFFGKNKRKYEAMLGRANTMLAEKKLADLIITTSLAKEYFTLLAIKYKIELLKQQKENRLEYLLLSKKRATHELDNAMQLLDAEIRLKEIDKMLQITQANETIQQIKINYLVGKAPLDSLCITSTFYTSNHKLSMPSSIGLDLLARRPDLSAQIWAVDFASKEVGVAKAEFYPNIDLTARGGVESLHLSNLFTHDSLMGFIKPALNLPLFVGGKLKANLSSKLFAFNQEVYKYNNMLLDAAREVTEEIEKIKQSTQIIISQEAIFDDAINIYNLHLSRFNIGLDNYLVVLDKNYSMLSQKINLLEANLSRQVQVVKLIKSLGGGFYQPIDIQLEVNNGRRK